LHNSIWADHNDLVLLAGQGNTSTAPQSLLSKPTKLETQIGTGAHFATLGQAVTFIVDGTTKKGKIIL